MPTTTATVTTPVVTSPLVNAGGAAAYLQVDTRTLKAWRSAGTGPRFIPRGSRHVYYRIADLDAWIETQVVDPATRQAVA